MRSKFNGFELAFLIDAIDAHVEVLEDQIKAVTESGKQSLFGEGYWRNVIGKELKDQVKHMTSAKGIKDNKDLL